MGNGHLIVEKLVVDGQALHRFEPAVGDRQGGVRSRRLITPSGHDVAMRVSDLDCGRLVPIGGECEAIANKFLKLLPLPTNLPPRERAILVRIQFSHQAGRKGQDDIGLIFGDRNLRHTEISKIGLAPLRQQR
ncbi:MAG: hypothetical protein HC838_03100 [Spirulinaceae cyanobacterium RM2_2_10]|nr:hypothetical protein [Spirulinaceae cyanobacterium RM2_2_10]